VKRVEAAHPGQRVRVWHQDEARFGQQGTLTRTWAATGTRPTAVRQTQYEYLWVLTAACGESGQAVGLMSPHLNAGVINVFLAQFARELPPDEHALLMGRGGVPQGQGVGDPDERDDPVPAAVRPGIEPAGEPVALPAEPLLVEPAVRRLRRVDGRGHHGLACGLPDRKPHPKRLRL
jgi:hypothetical protein